MLKPVEIVSPDAKQMLDSPLKWWVRWGTLIIALFILTTFSLSFLITTPVILKGDARFLSECSYDRSTHACYEWVFAASMTDQAKFKPNQFVQLHFSNRKMIEGEIVVITKQQQHVDFNVKIIFQEQLPELNGLQGVTYQLIVGQQSIASQFFQKK